MLKMNLLLKRYLSFALVFVLLLSMVPASVITAGASEIETEPPEVTESIPAESEESQETQESEPEETEETGTIPQETEMEEVIPVETETQESTPDGEEMSGSDANQKDSASEETRIVTEEVLISEEIYGFKGETSSDDIISFFSQSSLVTNPTAANWIDRLSVGQTYLDFYNWLGEQTSGDATDALIIGSYTGEDGKSSSKYPIVSFTDTVEYPTVDFTDSVQLENAYNNAASAVRSKYQNDISLAQQCIRAVYPAFLRDHPGLFWLTGSMYLSTSTGYSASYFTNKPGGSVTITITIGFGLNSTTDSSGTVYHVFQEGYRNNPTAIIADISKRDAAINAIISTMNSAIGTDADKYEKLVWLNDYVTKSNCYNTYVSNGVSSQAGFHAWTCMGALIHHSGKNAPVCESYAKTFMLLCQQIGVPCILVDGTGVTSSGSGAHMWNYVRMEDNNWYLCDLTWNDPTGSTELASGYENTNYLLKGSTDVASSHIVVNAPLSNGITYGTGPILCSSDYTYTPSIQAYLAYSEVYQDENGNLCCEEIGSNPEQAQMQIAQGDSCNAIFFHVEPGADGNSVLTPVIPAANDYIGVVSLVDQGAQVSADDELAPYYCKLTVLTGTEGQKVELKIAGETVNGSDVTGKYSPAVIEILHGHTFCQCSSGTEDCDHCVYEAPYITKTCMGTDCTETRIVEVADAAVASVIHADESYEKYMSVSSAMRAAAEGELIQLLKNTSEELVYLRDSKTIDLNGYSLTADLFIGVTGTNLIDSSENNTGILIADADSVQLSVSNSQFPVYTGTGYVFTEVNQYNHMISNNSDGNTKYVTQPIFEPFVHQYLGSSTDSVDVAVRLRWDFGTGISSQNFIYFDEQVAKVTASYKASTGKYSLTYSAILQGAVDLETYALTGVIISDTGAEVRAVDVTALIDRR